MLPALLLALAIAMIVGGWWRRKSLASIIAERLRGPVPSRPRSSLAWAAGILVMYGATSLVALALVGRLDALVVLPPELVPAVATLGIAPIDLAELGRLGVAIGGGFVLGAALVVLALKRGWRWLDPPYRSSAVAMRGDEVGAALALSGDLLAPRTDDPRLVPAYVASGDPEIDDVAREIGLGRTTVLGPDGRAEAAQRW